MTFGSRREAFIYIFNPETAASGLEIPQPRIHAACDDAAQQQRKCHGQEGQEMDRVSGPIIVVA
jgi:hypothetical protein